MNGIRAKGILEAVAANDLAKARQLQKESNDLIEAVLANGLYPTLKRLLQLQGCDKGDFLSRKPMASMTDEQIKEADRIYKEYV